MKYKLNNKNQMIINMKVYKEILEIIIYFYYFLKI
jgi:hypothetical protein